LRHSKGIQAEAQARTPASLSAPDDRWPCRRSTARSASGRGSFIAPEKGSRDLHGRETVASSTRVTSTDIIFVATESPGAPFAGELHRRGLPTVLRPCPHKASVAWQQRPSGPNRTTSHRVVRRRHSTRYVRPFQRVRKHVPVSTRCTWNILLLKGITPLPYGCKSRISHWRFRSRVTRHILPPSWGRCCLSAEQERESKVAANENRPVADFDLPEKRLGDGGEITNFFGVFTPGGGDSSCPHARLS
jgi:hypothetical protein